MKRLLFLVFLGVIGAYFFRTFAYEGIYLATDSMGPLLPEGTHVMVNKFILKFRSPKRGEVVMFEMPEQPSKGLVKRVIAIEGDSIEIKDKKVFLNDQVLDELYVEHTRPNEILIGDNMPKLVIPKGHVFVMGDNRDVSNDSRDWKNQQGEHTPFLSISNIQGLVIH